MAAAVLYAWATPSSRRTTVYETCLLADGEMTCNCPAWCFAKRGLQRVCRHTREKYAEARQILADVRAGRPIPRLQVPAAVPLKRAVGDGLVDDYIGALEL